MAIVSGKWQAIVKWCDVLCREDCGRCDKQAEEAQADLAIQGACQCRPGKSLGYIRHHNKLHLRNVTVTLYAMHSKTVLAALF